jgi:hypothetical protein
MRRLRRWALGVPALATAFIGGAGGAVGAVEGSPITPAAEAWYPTGIGVVAAPLYPAGTLHVGAAAGQETDRTYLHFDLPAPSSAAEVEGVTLTVPVSADAGTRAPEAAEIAACRVSGQIEDGGSGEPPAAECDGAPAATFVAGDEPSFTVDLTALAGHASVQFALVPSGGDQWHVGFDSRRRQGGRPATVTVSYTEPLSATTTTVSPTTVPHPLAPSPPTFEPPSGNPLLDVPDVSPGPVAAGQVIAEEAEASSSVQTIVTPDSRFRYPAVFGVPLALIVIVAIAGDGLTRPVRLRGDTG